MSRFTDELLQLKDCEDCLWFDAEIIPDELFQKKPCVNCRKDYFETKIIEDKT